MLEETKKVSKEEEGWGGGGARSNTYFALKCILFQLMIQLRTNHSFDMFIALRV